MTPNYPHSSSSSFPRRKQKKKKNRMTFLGIFFMLIGVASIILLLIYTSKSNQTAPDNPLDTSTVESTTIDSETTEPNQTEIITSAPETTSPETTEPEEIRISVAAAGDVLIHECVFLDAKNGSSYHFTPMLEGISSLISNADIAYVNMECPIAGNNNGIRGYPNFNAPTEAGDALVELGFNVINIANNHMLDMEKITTGYQNTINYWNSKDVLMIGGYTSKEDYNTIRYVEISGIKIAFLSYTLPMSKTVNSSSASLVLPIIDDNTIKTHIAKAKEETDFVVVSMHWGEDKGQKVYQSSANQPTAEQKRLGQLIADAGADVILGMHSHTLQPITYLTGKSGNKTLCVYSLGNLISSQLYFNTIVENILTFDIVVDKNNNISLENVLANPVICHYETSSTTYDSQGFLQRQNIRLYLLKDYTESLCSIHGAQLAYPDYKPNAEPFSMESIREHVRSILSKEFLPDYLQ